MLKYCSILFSLVFVSCADNSKETEAFSREEAEELARLYKKTTDSATQEITEEAFIMHSAPENVLEFMLFNESDMRCIRQYDSTVTTDWIITELKKRNDIIPVKEVFSGQPLNINRVVLLKYPWAYCYISDAHIAGYMLVEYSVKRKGIVNFMVLETSIDNC